MLHGGSLGGEKPPKTHAMVWLGQGCFMAWGSGVWGVEALRGPRAMAVNSTHADYDAALAGWSRARDLLAGEDAVKAAGVKYLPRLEAQTEDEYQAYKGRACFFNATRRAADAFVGLVFRKAPFVRMPESAGAPAGGAPGGIGVAMSGFANDADMLGTSLFGYTELLQKATTAILPTLSHPTPA